MGLPSSASPTFRSSWATPTTKPTIRSWHGEIFTIKRFYELPRESRPESRDCIFLATHEPCSLCLSGITWSGFDNFYYLFSAQDTRDAFNIPHDIRILKEVYAVPDPDREAPAKDRDYYNRDNAFFSSHSIPALVAGFDRGTKERLVARIDDLSATYKELSDIYQQRQGQQGHTAQLMPCPLLL